MNQKYQKHEIRSRPGKSRIDRDYNTNEVWISIVFLSVFGLLMVFSASSIQCISYEMYGNDSMFFLKKQLAFTIAGIIVCFISQYINYSIFFRFAKIMYLISIFTILLLKTPLGITANGATRWLNIGGIQFQVAEIVKISVIIMLSYMVQNYAKYVDTLALTIRLWCIGGLVAFLLVIISNDLSSSLVILGITFGITFIYTRKEKLHFFIIGFSIIIIGIIICKLKLNLPTSDELGNMSFRVGRIAAWIDPEKYSSTQGYQTMQSLYAIGSGGLFGKGLGNSAQKISAIPEA